MAIDPGPVVSALVVLVGGNPVELLLDRNELVLARLRCVAMKRDLHLVVEGIASYGMAVGASVFETCEWGGRFIEAWDAGGGPWSKLYRREVKLELCGSARAKDANVRQALIDLYGGAEGKSKAVGTKKSPGPLYGVKKDLWAALAVGVTWERLEARGEARGEG
ncbi:MAG: hypothetical protein ACQGVC_18165 [Myxococcota bacterium]